jgi:hypothetical protein
MHSDLGIVTAGLLSAALAAVTASTAFAEKNPLREAYFGETHVHTSWSFDAYIFGNHIAGRPMPTSTPRAKRSSIRSAIT